VTNRFGSRRRLAALARAGAAAAALWACAFALAPDAARAGTTGKIAGRVVDAKGAPLVGVSVAVPSLRVGAESDTDGRFTILNVAPGTYDVRANLLGYGPVLTTGLVVSADLTTRLDLALKESAVQLKEVVVHSTRPVVDVGKTNSLQSVTAKEISKLPVQNLDDVVNLQAGVVDGHFRGGRLGEVQYQVDGVSVNKSLDAPQVARFRLYGVRRTHFACPPSAREACQERGEIGLIGARHMRLAAVSKHRAKNLRHSGPPLDYSVFYAA
jgi:hypothetical protein